MDPTRRLDQSVGPFRRLPDGPPLAAAGPCPTLSATFLDSLSTSETAGPQPASGLSQKSERSPIETPSMTAHRGAATGLSNRWNSVAEARASKHNSMAVSTDHHPPCSGPRRGPDSPRGVTIHAGCKMAADLRAVGWNSTALLSGRTQPTDREDHRPSAAKRISFQRQLSSLVSWPIHRLRENPSGQKVVGHPTSCNWPRRAGRHHPNPPPIITVGPQIAKPLTHHSKGVICP